MECHSMRDAEIAYLCRCTDIDRVRDVLADLYREAVERGRHSMCAQISRHVVQPWTQDGLPFHLGGGRDIVAQVEACATPGLSWYFIWVPGATVEDIAQLCEYSKQWANGGVVEGIPTLHVVDGFSGC